MKCPKCGYIGFEQTERCRNCGYDFVLASADSPEAHDFPLRKGEAAAFGDFDLGAAAPPTADGVRRSRRYDPDLDPRITPPGKPASIDLPLFEDASAEELPIVPAAAPTPPLAVRRSTPPAVRTRPRPTPRTIGMPPPDTRLPLADVPPPTPGTETGLTGETRSGHAPAPLGARFLSSLVDWLLLLGTDAVVVYFTLKICRLEPSQLAHLPLAPLAVFLVLLDGGYLTLLTAAGGQTIGKMAFGLKVVAGEDGSVTTGRAIGRSLALMAGLAAAGVGLVPVFFTSGRRGLHDLLAGTRVIGTGRDDE